MDKWILKIIAFFKPLFLRQQVDYEKMMAIVEVKLMMDKRRVYMAWKQNQQQKENQNQLTMTFLMYGLIGAFLGITIITMPFLLGMIIMHSYLLMMMSMTLITDFSNVLLDTTDNQVLLPKPINSRTVFMARLVHILVYLLQFFLALAIVPLGFIMFQFGIFMGLLFIVTSLLTVLFAVFLTYLLYMLVLRFGNEQKLKDIISYFQIALAIFFMVGFQILPRIINFQQLSAGFQLKWYSYLLPPVWMSLALETFYSSIFDTLHIGMLVLALLMPLFLFWWLIKYLAPSFSEKLAIMSVEGASTLIVKKNKVKKSWIEKISPIVCTSAYEMAGFELTWKLTGREKTFRIQFYPGLAYIFVFLFIILMKSGQNISMENLMKLSSTNSYLWLIYMPIFIVSNAIILSAFYDNFQASWIYQSTPLQLPGHIIMGSLKSLFIKFAIPVYLLMLAIALSIWGVKILPDFGFGLFNGFLSFVLYGFFLPKQLPFSSQPNTQQQTGRFIKTLLQILFIAVLVGIHYLLLKNKLIMALVLPVVIVLIWTLMKQIKQLSWNKIAI